MDRSWMYDSNRISKRFFDGIQEFVRVAVSHQSSSDSNMILCPCQDCNNVRGFHEVDAIVDHLVRRGFRSNYTTWTLHGERLDVGASTTRSGGLGKNTFTEKENFDVEDFFEMDRVEEMMGNVENDLNEEPGVFDYLMSATETELYPGCTNFSKLSGILKLFNLKAKHNWTDKSFTDLLKVLQKMLPKGNHIPDSIYDARKFMCPFGMEYVKIHACPNDCILYRNEYKDLHECPRCGVSRYKRKETSSGLRSTGSPTKVLWHLPIIPRIRRLFSDKDNARLLRWHADERKKDGMLRHPADSPQWRNIDRKFPHFGKEVRNLRIGLCTDGINPFGTMSTQHSSWPVLLTIYNLPPWLCMKRRFIMMPLLISGPQQPGNDICVYLQPLIEDLIHLWDEGVAMFDAYTQTHFTLHAMLFCTINDFPAYGNLSGYKTKGEKACPICDDDLIKLWLEHCGKNVYLFNRRMLPVDHPFRKMKKAFYGEIEKREARAPLRGYEVFERVKDIETVFGKPFKGDKHNLYKKRSKLWDLPYWKNLEVRHCLDLMHIEKNVFDAIVGTLLNMPGKTKDGLNARRDMNAMGRTQLAPIEHGKRYYLPPACFTLSKEEKKSFCKSLHDLKVPAGYSSNFRRFVSMNDLKLVGLKSHDCHIIMENILPIAIRGILPKEVRYTITRLCFFFKAISSKVIDPRVLDDLQDDVIETMCRFEMYFPPSFFDIMPHLVLHLVREVKLCGPVCMRYMWPFERHMGSLKGKTLNPARPEASIVQRTVAEEVAEYAGQYLVETEPIGLPKSRHEGRLGGYGTLHRRTITFDAETRRRLELFVLQNLSVVNPYVEEHMSFLKDIHPQKNERQLKIEHDRKFVQWFKARVTAQLSSIEYEVSETLRFLAYGPKSQVNTYDGYDINGYSFYTKQQDDKSTMQNSGVSLVAVSSEFANPSDNSPVEVKKPYYGFISEIYELEYKTFTVALFQCKWVDNRRGVKEDEYGLLTLVNFSRLGHQDESLILASQAKQVFYMTDPTDSRWSVVIEGKRRILGVEDVIDEQDYDDQFNQTLSSVKLPSSHGVVDDDETTYIRQDHDEGLFVKKDKK